MGTSATNRDVPGVNPSLESPTNSASRSGPRTPARLWLGARIYGRFIKHGAYGATHLVLAILSLACANALMFVDQDKWRASWVCGMVAPMALAISAFAFRVPVKQPAPATNGKRLDIINTKF
eukprot:SAG31_NODE_21934_length_537_cov_1.527397_1_plen_121_part_01